jgi:hypothetical protein
MLYKFIDSTTPPIPWNDNVFKAVVDGEERTFANPTDEQLKQYNGHKELIVAEPPEPSTYNVETQYPSPMYAGGEVITQSWEIKDITIPDESIQEPQGEPQ